MSSASVAIGSNTMAKNDYDVALGAGSKTEDPVATAGITINGVRHEFAGTDPHSTVSVGYLNAERTITNVAAGRITETSTDAVNGSQLHGVIEEINKGVVYAGDVKTAAAPKNDFKQKLGAQTTIKGGVTDVNALTDDNIGVVSNGKDTLTVKLKKNLDLGATGSVKMGNTLVNKDGMTITGGPKVLKSGIDAGSKQIKNVQSGGTVTTNAANIGDVQQAVNNAKVEIDQTLTAKGLKFEGNDGQVVHRNLGTKLTVKGGLSNVATGVSSKNLGVKKSADGNGLELVMSETPEFKSVTITNAPTEENHVTNKKYVDGGRTTVRSSDESILVSDTPNNNGHHYDVKVDYNKVAANTPLTYKANGANAKTVKLAEGLDFVDTENITASVDANGNLTIKMDKDLKADSLALKGKDGENGTSIRSGEATASVDGTNITRIVMEENGKKHDIATMDDGMKYGGVTDASKLTTEDNLGVVSDGNDNLKVRLAKDLKGLNSVTAKTVNADTVNATTVKTGHTTMNDNGVFIENDPSMTKAGINAGDKKITHVAPGTISATSTDAVNGSQLYGIGKNLNQLGDQINKVGAGADALSALHPLDFDPDDKWNISAGFGNYRNANAIALGAFYRPNEDTMFSAGVALGNGENMFNAGVSVKLGQQNGVSTSKVAMAKEIKDLQMAVRALQEQNKMLMEQGFGGSRGVIRDINFPDVPENHWAYNYVKSLADRGLLEGYPDGEFKGDRQMTRYEFAAIIYHALENGATADANMGRAMDEFAPEIASIQAADRFRIDRIKGNDNDRNKIERICVNKEDNVEKNDYRDVYGSHIQPMQEQV